ncbi:UNKNOWN [Stylonychia lemnae]|uniref:YHYH domain-containing protein n=1 Tax=Stylonychia lemnae TaxID=5949 RepID=A0A078B0H7_STYLE|nr:UNKNOWN [Stylonychia lemnae]|eukprot:CDW88160.1 UNKNOWN [Stylonychia lemnae]
MHNRERIYMLDNSKLVEQLFKRVHRYENKYQLLEQGKLKYLWKTYKFAPFNSEQICNKDGIKESFEECDDGEAESTRGCDDQCQVELGYRCQVTSNNGSGTFQCIKKNEIFSGQITSKVTQVKDYSNYLMDDSLNSELRSINQRNLADYSLAQCKNGKLDIGEQCDDGIMISSGCSKECKIRPGYGANLENQPLIFIDVVTKIFKILMPRLLLKRNFSIQNYIKLDAKGFSWEWYYSNQNKCNKTDGVLSQNEECDDGDITHSGGDGIQRCIQSCTYYGATCMDMNSNCDDGQIYLNKEVSAVYDQYFTKFKAIRYFYNTTSPTEAAQTSPITETATPMPTDSSTSPTPTTIYYGNSICKERNGIVEDGEICDNGLPYQMGYPFLCQTFDRCDDNCYIRPGWSCVSEDGHRSHCYKSCIFVGTECLDRNHEDGDGQRFYFNLYSCSKDCQVEWGYSFEIHKIQGSEFNITIHYDAGLFYETNPPTQTTIKTYDPYTTTNGPGTQTTQTTFQTMKPTFINNDLNANLYSHIFCYLIDKVIYFYLNTNNKNNHLTKNFYYNNQHKVLNYNNSPIYNYKLTYNNSPIYNYKLTYNNRSQINNYILTDNNRSQINNYILTDNNCINKTYNNNRTQNNLNWYHLANHNGKNQIYYNNDNQTINHKIDNKSIIFYNYNNDYHQGTNNYHSVKNCDYSNKNYRATRQYSAETADGEEVQCSDMKKCPDGSRPPCNWKRRTYTDCREKDNNSHHNKDKERRFLQNTNNTNSSNSTAVATLRIKTNSLPNHCFCTQESTQSTENDIDFEVEYRTSAKNSKNARILTESRNLIALDGKDQGTVNSLLCETAWTSTEFVQQVSPSYTEYSGNYKDIVGIAINGVPIHTGNSEYGSDIFFPKKYKDNLQSELTVELDSCLGSVQFLGFYHYYGWSPCILPSGPIATKSSSNCKDIDECKKDKLAYSISFMKPQEKNMTVIGIARDGHSILGPFRSDGQLWEPCDIDICNGVEIEGVYYYVTTLFHPYTVGCWGPGPMKQVAQQCSNNVKVCSQSKAILYAFETVMLLIFIYFAILY